MQEKEPRERYVVEGMDIHGRMILSAEVSVLNISAGGISLKADRRLDMGSEYALKLIEGEKEVSVKGTVVWSSVQDHWNAPLGDVVPIYTAGLTFTGLVSEKMTALLDFIGDHLAGEEHRLGGLRVTITNPEKAVLFYSSTYRVKKLSLRDMFIEGPQELPSGLRLPMEVSLPDDRPIRVSGRVTSCRHVHEKGSDHFDIGIDFVTMGEKEKERLKEFIGILHRMDNIS
jgi:Tfp pilus assembly protein PilZ